MPWGGGVRLLKLKCKSGMTSFHCEHCECALIDNGNIFAAGRLSQLRGLKLTNFMYVHCTYTTTLNEPTRIAPFTCRYRRIERLAQE